MRNNKTKNLFNLKKFKKNCLIDLIIVDRYNKLGSKYFSVDQRHLVYINRPNCTKPYNISNYSNKRHGG